MMCVKKFSPNLRIQSSVQHQAHLDLFSPLLCKVAIFRPTTNRTLDAKRRRLSRERKFSTERGGEFLDAHEEEEEEYEDGIHGRRPGGEHRDVED